MSDRPRGLAGSERFADYLEDLRETWPADPELARKYGVAAGNSHSHETMSATESDETEQLLNQKATRRTFLTAAGAAGAAAFAGVGAAQQTGGLNYGSDLVPDPWIEGTVTIGEHDTETMSSVLEYINDSDTVATLADHGARVMEREDESTPHNPISLRADQIDAADYYKFPRGEQYDESGDGDAGTDLDVIDATHWTVDESGSAGSLTVEDVDAPSGGPGLRVAASGQGSGDTAVATFNDFEIADGELRKYLQLVLDIDALPSGSVATVRLTDSASNTVEATIDPSADAATDSVIAAATATGHVYQIQLGDLVSSLDNIQSLEIELADGDIDLSFYGINIERSSRWEFGTREFTNAADEVDTETVTEPSGSFSITGIDTLGSMFDAASLTSVDVSVEFLTSGISDGDMIEYEFEELEHPTYDRRFRYVVNRKLPTAYDLEYSDLTMHDETIWWSEQYETLEIGTGLSEQTTLEDIDDDQVDLVDRSGSLGSKGDEFELSSTVTAGEYQTVYYQGRINSEDESEMIASGASGPAASGGGDFWSSARGLLVGGVTGVAAFLAIFRSRIMG